MPARRASARGPSLTTPASQSSHQPSPALAASSDATTSPPQLLELRRQWKWAAFSQFMYTFAPLIAMDDITVAAIEEDLVESKMLVLPRVMHRLLVTLSQDRKLTLLNWQSGLRKQYLRRAPEASPLGPEPKTLTPTPSPRSSPVPDTTVVSNDVEMDGVTPDAIKDEPTPDSSAIVEASGSDHLVNENLDHFASNNKFVSEVVEESRDWADLSMLEKLDSMHLLTEWQFQNTHRLRTTMKSDDEGASWRIEPIGFDSKRNAYWHIGDRLWMQREPPKPLKKIAKRKKQPITNTSKRPASESGHDTGEDSSKRRRSRLDSSITNPTANPDRAGSLRTTGSRQPTASGSRARAAKTQANVKLDAQARELAALQREARNVNGASNNRKQLASPRKSIIGTRVSTRLRGAIKEDEWQEIPEEWLIEAQPESDVKGKGKARESSPKLEAVDEEKPGLEDGGDALSELTELSDSEDGQNGGKGSSTQRNKSQITSERVRIEDSETATPEDEEVVFEEPPPLRANFVEWETIAVTLPEWERVAEPFANSSHYLEKTLYKILSQDVVPYITETLREVERKRRLEEALNHRKRSSRIAVKESEKEEARAAAKRKAEEEEKMARERRIEARTKKEEEARLKREMTREQRRMEREERELRRAKDNGSNKDTDMPVDVVDDQEMSISNRNGLLPSKAANGIRSGTRTPVGDDWELDCEICHSRGINRDDGLPVVCCGKCSKWHHITCHDKADQKAGHPRRNWDLEEFVCRQCQLKAMGGSLNGLPPAFQRHYAPRQQFFEQSIGVYPTQPQSAQTPTGQLSYPQNGQRVADHRFNVHHQKSPADYGHAQQASSVNGSGARGHIQHQPVHRNAAATYAVDSNLHRSPMAVTFAHYQPEHRGFSTSAPPNQQFSQLQHQIASRQEPSPAYQSDPRQQRAQVQPSWNNSATYSQGHHPSSPPYAIQPPHMSHPYSNNSYSNNPIQMSTSSERDWSFSSGSMPYGSGPGMGGGHDVHTRQMHLPPHANGNIADPYSMTQLQRQPPTDIPSQQFPSAYYQQR